MAVVGIVKIVARLVEGFVVIRGAMDVHNEYPLKTLLAELSGKIHEDRPHGFEANGIGAGKDILAADLVGPAHPQRDDRKHEGIPAGPLRNGFGEPLGHLLVHVAVRIGRKIGAVLLENSARQKHGRLLPI